MPDRFKHSFNLPVPPLPDGQFKPGILGNFSMYFKFNFIWFIFIMMNALEIFLRMILRESLLLLPDMSG